MNRQAKMLLLLCLLLLVALSPAGTARLRAGAQDADGVAQRAAPGYPSESEMPPLVGGTPKTPENVVPQTPERDAPEAINAPVITIWYGNSQQFGVKGDPQKWVNIVGNVASAAPLSSLTYTVNGGAPQALSFGPDNMRLALAGDFNIELDYTDLLPGNNQIVITAMDNALGTSQAVVTVAYAAHGPWPLQTYTYTWAGAAKVTDVAQVVDGNWVIDGGTARPAVLDFDRLLAIGDLSWRDYTVTVPITILSIDPAGFPGPSNGPGVGVMVRWQGHFTADGDGQPRTGWRRLGALGWYRWKNNPVPSEGLQLLGHRGLLLGESTKTLSMNTTYMFKINVTSNASPGKPATYRFKVWEAAQTEPATWDIEQLGNSGEPRSGSILLLAHHVDAKFGNVTVDLDSVAAPPTLQVTTTGTGTGDVDVAPTQATYRFGEDVTLTATPDGGSSFVEWLGDLSGNTNPATLDMFGNRSVAALFVNPNVQTPISDDFSDCELNTGLWTYINPADDSPLTMTGSQVQIAVPANAGHDIWTGGVNAPRIMQYAENENFEFEVKFDSAMSSKNQAQGVLVEGNAQNFLRYNFLHDGSTYRIQAYTFTLGAPTERVNQAITIAPPMYLKVKRVGNVWNLYHSTTGTTWTFAAGFQYDLVVDAYGPYVGNSSKNPAMTGQIDYFFNTSSPIVPEDTDRKLTTASSPVDAGTVARDPLKENYACDEPVTLTPVPAPGYKFDHWSGDLSGNANPATLIMNGTKSVTAHFVTDVQFTVNVSASGPGTVSKSPDKPGYSAGESVTLTATPAIGNLFTGWTGDVTGSTNPVTVVVTGNMTVAGNFAAAPPRTLTINAVGNGGVAKFPDKATYLHGESVTLTAVPSSGASFIGWSDALSGATNPTAIIMDADKTVTATFADNIYTLTLTPDPNGTINANPVKPAYYQDEQVTLTAVPAVGYKFSGWSGDLTGNTNPATLVMTKNSTVTATFVVDASYTVEVTEVGNGTVIKDPEQPEYNFGDEVTLTAFPGAGQEFVGWSGDLTGNENPATITVTKDMAITATFGAAGIYSLTIVPPTNGTITADPVRALYAPGEQVMLTATPAFGYILSSWGGDASGTTSPFVLTMDGNKTVSASFVEAPIYTLSLSSGGNGTVTATPPGPQITHGTMVTLTATASSGFAFAGWSGDVASLKNPYVFMMDGNKTIVGNFTESDPPESDDFDGCGDIDLRWEWVDPQGGADYEMTGTGVRITVPEGANYEVWKNGNKGARFMQEVSNSNFSLMAKIDSAVASGQLQGILIEAAENHFIRVDIYHDGDEVRFFAGIVDGNKGSVRVSTVVEAGAESHILVRRTGDRWKLFYRNNGADSWQSIGQFNYGGIAVARVGVFVGSQAVGATPAPGHAATFDYFFNEDLPIAPEDANAPSIVVNTSGQGTVVRDPAGAAYRCGQQVELRATPANGWRFLNWSGDMNGSSPVQILTVSKKHTITATFLPLSGFRLYLPATIK